LLELQCVLLPRRLRHIRYPFALEQLAKSDVLQGQGHSIWHLRYTFDHSERYIPHGIYINRTNNRWPSQPP
jgi:hypothetical protein